MFRRRLRLLDVFLAGRKLDTGCSTRIHLNHRDEPQTYVRFHASTAYAPFFADLNARVRSAQVTAAAVNRAELMDLIAYLLSGGNSQH